MLKIIYLIGICGGAVKLMKTRIRSLPQPKSMRPIIVATQREQRHGLVWNRYVNKNSDPATPDAQPNPTPSPCCAFSGPRAAKWRTSGLVLKWLNGECFVIRRHYKSALPYSSQFTLTTALTEWFNFCAAWWLTWGAFYGCSSLSDNTIKTATATLGRYKTTEVFLN